MSATFRRPIFHGAATAPGQSSTRPRTEAQRSTPDSGGFLKRHRRALLAVVGVAGFFGFVHYVFPQIVGLGPTLRRLQRGNAWRLGLGGLVEILSIAGEVVLLRGVFSRPGSRIG